MIASSPKVQSALAVARNYPDELAHLEQVGRLSSLLFSALKPVHGMSAWDGELVCCAGLLHDIGISVSYSGHHKHSRKLIQKSSLPALARNEIDTVALIARYHRRSAPAQRHKRFAKLPVKQQQRIARLAAILRIADGLDRAHENAVVQLRAKPESRGAWRVELYGGGDLAYAAASARRKAELFEAAFGVQIQFEPKGVAPAGPDSWM